MLQLLEDDLNFARVGGMDLDPVDDFLVKIRRAGTRPRSPIAARRDHCVFKQALNVNASLDASCVLGVDPVAIDFAQGPEALLPGALRRRVSARRLS